jgi:hypothetical protein
MTVKTPKAREDVVFRPLAEEWVLFDPRRHLVHVLNLTAALVWTHCDGEISVEDLIDEVAFAFPEAPARADLVRDIDEALKRFQNEELFS